MRKTLYGTLINDKELNENEKAMLYIKECAELVGMEVIDGETAFTVGFMAEIMRKLSAIIEAEGGDSKGDPTFEEATEKMKGASNVLDKISADLHATAELHDDGDYYLREEWIDEYFDKYKVEREDKYEAILKTDMVAMLEEIQKEIEENVLADDPNTLLPFLQARETCVAVIQQKINALKTESEK